MTNQRGAQPTIRACQSAHGAQQLPFLRFVSFSFYPFFLFFFLALDGRHIVRHGSINVIAVRELALPLRFSFLFLQNARAVCSFMFYSFISAE